MGDFIRKGLAYALIAIIFLMFFPGVRSTVGGWIDQMRESGEVVASWWADDEVELDPDVPDLPGGFDLPGGSNGETTPDTTATDTTVGATTTTVARVARETTGTATVAGFTLGVANYDQTAADSYNRDDWPHWNDTDNNGCDARNDTLAVDSLTEVTTVDGCLVESGRWIGPYSGLEFTDPSDIDIDHMVPLKAAQASGAGDWTRDQRETFANDPSNLLATSASFNRSKSDKSPDQWRPGFCERSAPGFCDNATVIEFKGGNYNADTWCDYSTQWADVKAEYSLTVTSAEATALTEMQAYC